MDCNPTVTLCRAPEAKTKRYDGAVDVWSYGIVLWEIWSIHSSATTVDQFFRDHPNGGEPPPVDAVDTKHEMMKDIIAGCTRKASRERRKFRTILDDLTRLKTNGVSGQAESDRGTAVTVLAASK